MSLCLIQTACLTDQFQTHNPESFLSGKARSCSTDTDLEFFFFFLQILDTWLLEPLSRLSSVTRICILAYPRWMKLFWFCLFTQQQERTFSCLSFWALAKICWSSQSEPELIRITGLFNLNSGFRSQLLEGVDAYLPARNCLLILETFVRCRVEKLQLSFPKRVLHTRG